MNPFLNFGNEIIRQDPLYPGPKGFYSDPLVTKKQTKESDDFTTATFEDKTALIKRITISVAGLILKKIEIELNEPYLKHYTIPYLQNKLIKHSNIRVKDNILVAKHPESIEKLFHYIIANNTFTSFHQERVCMCIEHAKGEPEEGSVFHIDM